MQHLCVWPLCGHITSYFLRNSRKCLLATLRLLRPFLPFRLKSLYCRISASECKVPILCFKDASPVGGAVLVLVRRRSVSLTRVPVSRCEGDFLLHEITCAVGFFLTSPERCMLTGRHFLACPPRDMDLPETCSIRGCLP